MRPLSIYGYPKSWFGQPLKQSTGQEVEEAEMDEGGSFDREGEEKEASESALMKKHVPIMRSLSINGHPISWFGQPLKETTGQEEAELDGGSFNREGEQEEGSGVRGGGHEQAAEEEEKGERLLFLGGIIRTSVGTCFY
jgi:hypothetical protein